MKKKLIMTICLMAFLLLFTGCVSKNNQTTTHSENDLLNQLAAYTYEDSTQTVGLTLSGIELKLSNTLSGQVAMIYTKNFDAAKINETSTQNYLAKESSNQKALIKAYGKIEKSIVKKLKKLPSGATTPEIQKFLESLRAHVTEIQTNGVKSVDDEIAAGTTLLTILDQAIIQDFKVFGTSDSVAAVKLSLERVKNLDLQKVINTQSDLKTKLATDAQKQEEARVTLQLKSDFKKMISAQQFSDKNEITIKTIGSNDQELFVQMKFKHLGQVYGDFVWANKANIELPAEQNSNFQSAYAQVWLQYLMNAYESPEIASAKNYMEEVTYKIDSLEIIKLEVPGQQIIKKYTGSINKVLNSYKQEVKSLRNTLLDQLLTSDASAIAAVSKTVETDAVTQLNQINDKYKTQLSPIFESLQKDLTAYKTATGKIADDSKSIDKILKMVSQYDEHVATKASDLKSLEALQTIFEANTIGYFAYEQPLPVAMRVTIEGKYLYKYAAADQVDTESNYFLNAQSSGDNALRITENVPYSIFLMDIKDIGLNQIKWGFYGYAFILLLFFIFKRDWFKKAMVVTVLLLMTCIVVYPLAWVVGSSFNESQSLGSVGISPFPKKLSFIQYERLFLTTNYFDWFKNTLKIALSNMVITVTLAVSAAYVFSRFKFKGKKVGMMTMLIIQIFPSFSAMVAIYTLLANIKLLNFLTGQESLVNTHIGLILVYTAGQIPFNTWLVKGYLDTIPRSLDEAAKIDGASNLEAFWKIILPLGFPIISFVAITSFMAPWMDFILPRLLLKSTEKKTLAVGLWEMINGKSNNSFTMFAAGAVLVAVPITIMYAYFQKYIVTGLSSGAVKE